MRDDDGHRFWGHDPVGRASTADQQFGFQASGFSDSVPIYPGSWKNLNLLVLTTGIRSRNP